MLELQLFTNKQLLTSPHHVPYQLQFVVRK